MQDLKESWSLAKSLYTFDVTSTNNNNGNSLFFPNNSIIKVEAKSESGWWFGQLIMLPPNSNDNNHAVDYKVGLSAWFPSNFVSEITDKKEQLVLSLNASIFLLKSENLHLVFWQNLHWILSLVKDWIQAVNPPPHDSTRSILEDLLHNLKYYSHGNNNEWSLDSPDLHRLLKSIEALCNQIISQSSSSTRAITIQILNCFPSPHLNPVSSVTKDDPLASLSKSSELEHVIMEHNTAIPAPIEKTIKPSSSSFSSSLAKDATKSNVRIYVKSESLDVRRFILKYLLDSNMDEKYRQVFFTTYNTFLSPRKLLDILSSFYQDDDLKSQVVGCMKTWIHEGFEAPEEIDIIPQIKKFLDELEPLFPARTKDLRLLMIIKAEKARPNSIVNSVFGFSNPSDWAEIFSTTPKEIANSIYNLELKSYQRVKSFDIVATLNNQQTMNSPRNIFLTAKLIDWMIYLILSSRDFSECSRRVKFFIDAAIHSINIHGYSFAFACCIALNSKYIFRLQKLFTSLGVNYADKLKKIRKFGQISYYDRLIEENKGNHPYLPIFDFWIETSFTDLVSFNSEETIHFAVLEGMSKKLKSYKENISKLRNQASSRKDTELVLQSALQVPIPVDHFSHLSKKLEGRKHKINDVLSDIGFLK